MASCGNQPAVVRHDRRLTLDQEFQALRRNSATDMRRSYTQVCIPLQARCVLNACMLQKPDAGAPSGFEGVAASIAQGNRLYASG
jgi:hypothetical protein